jgi:hypothetical protein
MSELGAADFPLPGLAARLERWRREVERGRGFVVISGVPVERWSEEDCELFFWCLGGHLGIPGAQNKEGDLLGHVRDDRSTAPEAGGERVRRYRTREQIGLVARLLRARLE